MKPRMNCKKRSLHDLLLQGWLYASELYHFVQFISKAKTRNVEALYCPESAVLYQTENWEKLRKQLHHSKVMGKVLRNNLSNNLNKQFKESHFESMVDELKKKKVAKKYNPCKSVLHHSFSYANYMLSIVGMHDL